MTYAKFVKIFKKLSLFHLVAFVVFLVSCNNVEYYPKPRGYFRIDIPEKNYQQFDSTFPYRFEYPGYANINFDGLTPQNPYWMNLDFPEFGGKIHMSYKSLDEYSLFTLQEDAHEMVFKHAPKAIAINQTFYSNPQNKVYGLVYSIDGKDAASPYQFYLTDSTHHFVRGALYFNIIPNNDSLEPVINFMKEDVNHLFDTFSWKE